MTTTKKIKDPYTGEKITLHYHKIELLTMQCNTPEQTKICEQVKKYVKNNKNTYDYVIGYETKDESTHTDHIHIAIKWAEEICTEQENAELKRVQIVYDDRTKKFIQTNMIGLNIKIPPDKDTEKAWADIREYARKGGNYEWLHAVYPKKVENENPQWLSWQREIIEEKQNDRQITLIIDKKGGIGKSYLALWHAVRNKAVQIELVKDHKDLLRQVYAQPANWYIFDIPRAMSKQQQHELYSAIEKIKDGISFDDRYSFKKRYSLNNPKITVFTNEQPDRDLLTWDRWIVHKINKEKNEFAKREIAQILKSHQQEPEKQPEL